MAKTPLKLIACFGISVYNMFLFSCFSVSVVIDPNEEFLRHGKDPVLNVLSAGHALHVFINGQLSGGYKS